MIAPLERFGLLLFAVACLFASGCEHKAGRSILGTTVAGREVTASLDGNGFISGRDDVAVVRFALGEMVVAKDRVDLDGKELAKIPGETKKVEIDYTNGALMIKADGETVLHKESTKK
jgi:hypothetical protein